MLQAVSPSSSTTYNTGSGFWVFGRSHAPRCPPRCRCCLQSEKGRIVGCRRLDLRCNRLAGNGFWVFRRSPASSCPPRCRCCLQLEKGRIVRCYRLDLRCNRLAGSGSWVFGRSPASRCPPRYRSCLQSEKGPPCIQLAVNGLDVLDLRRSPCRGLRERPWPSLWRLPRRLR
jgi:hypothetical protein